mgnify:CR=1 FL=1
MNWRGWLGWNDKRGRIDDAIQQSLDAWPSLEQMITEHATELDAITVVQRRLRDRLRSRLRVSHVEASSETWDDTSRELSHRDHAQMVYEIAGRK